MEQFFGFYTYPAFWIKPLITPYEDLNSYRNHIYKLKLRYDSIKYSIIIFNDGLVGIKIKGIELPETENDSLKATFILWQEYNKMSLLIMAILSEYININNINTYVAIEEIQAKDYGIIYIEDNEIKRYSYIALCYFTQIFCKRRLFENYCPELDVIHEQTLAAKNLLPETIIQYLGNKIDAIFSTDLEDVYYQLVKAIAEYKLGDYTTSFTNAWFIIEKLINIKWKKWITDKNERLELAEEKRISKERFKNLTDGTNFTISSVLNILELVGELSYNNFKALDVLRKKRNKVTHEHEHVTDADLCKKCFEQIGYIFMENSWPYFQLNYDVVVRPIC